MTPKEKSKKIGKYLILLTGRIHDVWTKKGTEKQSIYEVSVHLRQKGNVIEVGTYDNNKELALTIYRNMKTVSDVHKYLHEVNPTERPLRYSDARMIYNR